MKEKAKSADWSRRYQAALQKHLMQGAKGNLRTALALGRQAADLGLETLDVARIHQESMVALELASSKDGFIHRAEKYFAEVITPIEMNHQAALEASIRLDVLNKTLDRRTAELATSHRHLKQGIVRRKGAETALKKSVEHHDLLLEESRKLQEHLRQLTRRILSAQENKRKKVSRELQDEIAQTLLGINVRLLMLKNEASINAKGLKKEIASTQRLVEKSVRIMNRFGREYGKHHET